MEHPILLVSANPQGAAPTTRICGEIRVATDGGIKEYLKAGTVYSGHGIYVADSGNNRIQMFNSEGVFQRGFGRWGQGEGEFKGLEGIAVNSKGQILVADRENHRVQIF